MNDFDQRLKAAAEQSVLRIISDGSWIAPDYANRFRMPPEMLAEVWKLIDTKRLMAAMAARLETELADRIVNHLAAEIATDVKQILSVKERREALRHIAREHMDGLMKLGPKEKP